MIVMIAAITLLHINASPYTIVIDAGHGGKDVGAIGGKVYEKNVNLSVALKLGDLIKSEMNDVKVVYTRDNDKYLTLQERAKIANDNKGNLFISIHCNSLDKRNKQRKTIKGASTYTLGLHKSDENLEVAMRENSVISLEDNYEMAYHGFNPQSTESYIIFEISQSEHMVQSVDFASRVQNEMVKTSGRADRGVRQAGFLVLWQTSMPAVLIELDFICNPTQAAFLGSKSGQEKMARSIFNAFKKYKGANDNKIAAAENKVVAKQKEETIESVIQETVEDDKNEITSLIYKVQFLASPDKIENGDKRFKKLTGVEYYRDGGMFKYTIGNFASEDEAKEMLNRTKKQFKEAFIVVFEGDKRIK